MVPMTNSGHARDSRDSEREDLGVKPQRPAIDIVQVERESLLPSEGVAPAHLRQAGKAGANIMAALLFGRIKGEIIHKEGPRADQAHFAFKNIDELGKLIEACRAKEAARPAEALCILQQRAVGVAPVGHRAELDEIERTAVQSRALLPEQDWAADGCKDDEAGEEEERREENEEEAGKKYVNGPFGQAKRRVPAL